MDYWSLVEQKKPSNILYSIFELFILYWDSNNPYKGAGTFEWHGQIQKMCDLCPQF